MRGDYERQSEKLQDTTRELMSLHTSYNTFKKKTEAEILQLTLSLSEVQQELLQSNQCIKEHENAIKMLKLTLARKQLILDTYQQTSDQNTDNQQQQSQPPVDNTTITTHNVGRNTETFQNQNVSDAEASHQSNNNHYDDQYYDDYEEDDSYDYLGAVGPRVQFGEACQIDRNTTMAQIHRTPGLENPRSNSPVGILRSKSPAFNSRPDSAANSCPNSPQYINPGGWQSQNGTYVPTQGSQQSTAPSSEQLYTLPHLYHYPTTTTLAQTTPAYTTPRTSVASTGHMSTYQPPY